MTPTASHPAPVSPPAAVLPSEDMLPITLRKDTRSSRNPHPIYNFLSYHHLSSPFCAFLSSLSSISVPKTVSEALSDPGWRQTMVDERTALLSNGTWDLVPLPLGKSLVGCPWIYIVKVGPNG